MPATNFIQMLQPEVLAQQAELDRRQKLADYLREQSLAQLEPGSAPAPGGGAPQQAVKINPLQGLAKMGQAYFAGKMQEKNSADQLALNKQQLQGVLAMLKGGIIPGAQPGLPSSNEVPLQGATGEPLQGIQQAPGGESYGDTGSQSTPIVSALQAPPQAGMSDSDKFGISSLLRSGLINQVGGEAAGKAYWEDQAKTPTMKDIANLPESLRLAAWQNKYLSETTAAALAAGKSVPDANAGFLKKEQYIAPYEVKAENLALDPMNGNKPIAYNPGVAKGITPNFTTNAQGQTFPTGSSVLPNYAGNNAAIAGAEQGAKQANTVFTSVPGAGGEPQSGYGGALFGGRGGPAPSAPAPVFNTQPQFPQQRLPQPGGQVAPAQPAAAPQAAAPQARPGVMVGPGTTDQAIQKVASEQIAGAPAMVANSRSAINGLEAALRSLEGVKATGAGTAKTMEVLSAINNATGLNIQDANNNHYAAMNKFLNNSLAQASQATGANGSDARFEQFSHGQPNGELMPKESLGGAIRYVLSQHDAAAVKGQYLQNQYAQLKAAGDPNAGLTAQSNWSKIYQPDYFAFNRMSQPERVQRLQGLGQQGAADFVNGYKQYATQTGWVKP